MSAPPPLSPVRTLKSAAVSVTPAYRAAALAAAASAAAAAAGCETPPPPTAPDPCARVTFNADACEAAHSQRGYYYHGGWVPHIYPMPYAFYLGAHRNYVAGGGRFVPAPAGVYAPRYQPTSARAAGYLDRVSGGGAVRVGNPAGLPGYATGPGLPGSAAVAHRGGFGQTRAAAGGAAGRGANGFATGSAFAVATEGGYGGRHGAVAGTRAGGAVRLGGGAGRAFSGVSHAAGSRAVSRGGFGRTGAGRGGAYS